MDELCKNLPVEFKDFLSYCRALSFSANPDYGYILELFEGCMLKNNINIHEPEFIWNRNRLFLEKEALKQNVKKIISKPEPATKPNDKTNANDTDS